MNGPSWDGRSTPGLIDEAGSFADGSSSLRGRVKPSVPANKKDVFLVGHVFDVPFTVESFTVGNDTFPVEEGKPTTLAVTNNDPIIGSPAGVSYAFGMNGADDPGHALLVYGNTGNVGGARRKVRSSWNPRSIS